MIKTYLPRLVAALALASSISCSYFLARFVDESFRTAERRVYVEDSGFVAQSCLSLFDSASSRPLLADALGLINATSPAVFHALSEKQTSAAGISAVSLCSRVHPSLATEAAAELSEMYNTTIDLTYITDYQIGGDLFVLDYTYPENAGVLGLVVNSDEPRSAAVNTTVQSGEPAFLDHIVLADTGEPGRVAFYPVVSRQPIDTLFVAVLRYAALLEPLISQFKSKFPDSVVEVLVDRKTAFTSDPGRELSTEKNTMRFNSGPMEIIIPPLQGNTHGAHFVYVFVSGTAIVTCVASIMFLVNRARVRAQRYSSLKSRFLADMSHEIRAPMNGILGTTELLADMNLDSASRYHVNTISSCGVNLMTLINNILDMSKIEADLLDIRGDDIRVQQVIQSAVDHVWLSHRTKNGGAVGNLKLVVEFSPGVPEKIVGDGVRIQQVLSNLLTNSLKFTTTGYVKVGVSCFYTGRPGQRGIRVNTRRVAVGCTDDGLPGSIGKRYIRVSIRDTGSGMTAEGVKEAFKVFKRVHIGGAGLGLSICKKLCGLMGGDIEISSAPDKGTTVTFTVEAKASPGLHKLTAPSRNVYSQATPGAVNSTPTLRRTQDLSRSAISDTLEPVLSMTPRDRSTPPRVLVVDDVSINRKLLENILMGVGVAADTCDEGLRAVQMCDAIKYSFILMDMVMPVMNGTEATKRIRANKLNSKTPVVFVSANAQPDSIARCDASGGNGFVTKPVSKTSIMEVLVMHCSPDEKEHVRRHLSNPPV